MDDDALGKLLAEVHRDYADYRRAEGVSVSPSSVSVKVDRTGEPVERSDSDHFGFSVGCVSLPFMQQQFGETTGKSGFFLAYFSEIRGPHPFVLLRLIFDVPSLCFLLVLAGYPREVHLVQ